MKNICKSILAVVLAAIMTVSVCAAPIVSPALNVLSKKNTMIKSGLVFSDVYFSEQDFMKCLSLSEVDAVKVEKLPPAEDGVLKLGTLYVTEGQTIKSEYLSMLRFVPNSDAVMGTDITFFYGDTEVPCTVKLLDVVNFAPAFAENEDSVHTYRNVSCYGSVQTMDPEGDTVDLQVVTYPKHGTLAVLNAARGSYCYTPGRDFIGEDSFVVVARDDYGNYSSVQTVNVQVGKTGVFFTDVAGHWCENAAISLYENGAVEAASYQSGLVFCPEDPVSREEFITMAMKAIGVSVLTDMETSFADNASIDVRYRPYVATAQRMGYISGRETDGLMCFDPKATISKAEAAIVINNILELTAGSYIATFADDSAIPTWAKTAIYALTSAGVFQGDGDGVIAPSAVLNRAQTVQMLYNLTQVQ